MKSPEVRGLCPLIQVFDMPSSLAFYRDLLGFEVVQQAPAGEHIDWARLRRRDAELMVNTMFESDTRPSQADPERVVGHGDTTLYLSTPNVDAMYAYLRSHGVAVEPPIVAPYGMRQLSLKDPDGYGVCFQWPDAEPGAATDGGGV
jgi:uncharacterized glyoxalase superfamily protein PhnB